MAKCEIKVSVDTDNLNQENIDEKVTLSGCEGKDKIPGKSNTFETKVNGNTKIVWTPSAEHGTDTITISNIAVTSDANVFQYGDSPSGPGNEGQWEGQVKNNKYNLSVLSEYRIYFQVMVLVKHISLIRK